MYVIKIKNPDNFNYPREPTFTENTEHEQGRLINSYSLADLTTPKCNYCNRRRGGLLITAHTLKRKINNLLAMASYSSIIDTMPKSFDVIIEGSEKITLTTRHLTNNSDNDSGLKHFNDAVIKARLRKVIDVDECRLEFVKWAEESKSATEGYIKAGTFFGLEPEIPNTLFEQAKCYGHINGPKNPETLFSFDWPSPKALLYMLTRFDKFMIGIANKSHCHGN